MSVTPPLQGSQNATSPGANLTAHGAASRWGTISGGLRSPPPAPSSGAGVRRNHTIHGARHHGKPRLEKHFEQPEHPLPHQYGDISGQAAARVNDQSQGLQSSPSYRHHSSLDPLASTSVTSDGAGDFVSSLAPLQPLYSKSSVSRNLSLPSRHSSKLASNLPHSATHGRTSLFNSLSAITGGSDLDEHDWEKLILSSDALGDEHQQDPHASHSLSLQTDGPWSSSLFSQGQLGAPADSSSPTSPSPGSGLFGDAHHRTGSTSAVDSFDQQAALADAQDMRGSTNFIRRHQSLNHHSGRSAALRLAARSSDLLSRHASDIAEPSMPLDFRANVAFSPARHTTSLSVASSPIMPTSYSKAPWNQPTQDPIGSPSRFAASFPTQNLDGSHSRMNSAIDGSSASLSDVSKHLSNLDISGSSELGGDDTVDTNALVTATSRSMYPSLSTQSSTENQHMGGRKLPQLVTNRDALQRGQRANGASGPLSAAAFVPPIGHAHSRQQSNDPHASNATTFDADPSQRFGPFTAAPAGSWIEKDSIAGRNAADSHAWPHQVPAAYPSMGMDPNVVALSMALAQEQQRNAILQAQIGARNPAGGMQENLLFGMQPIDLNGPLQSIGQQLRGGPLPSSPPMGGMGNLPQQRGSPFPGMQHQSSLQFRPPPHTQAPSTRPPVGPSFSAGESDEVATPTPVDPTSLALQKGYNPALGTFDLTPPNARYFVIKSYTEDDVHKSLKYEIWASTDKGNQRLDKAFHESAHIGPIYLFYSVNASGHFCGMAQMLTPLDYATSSNVWAQDGKWKGTFKVRWIYVKDLPNNQLRHIRLTNTSECKPVTQSRDTQELTPEAGREVLRIMAEYGAKTSLLQDFNFYEMQGRGTATQAVGQQAGVQRPAPSSPALGLAAGLQGRNSPRPKGSPASAFGGVPFPTAPDMGFAARSSVASPNGGARRPQPAGTPQRSHGISGLGLAPGTPRMNDGVSQHISELRGDRGGVPAGEQRADDNKEAVSAAQAAGLAPSAL
ncbi:uncharacterized protein MEPE_03166 [Melanopsichium pennsylvanicum]|uniref:YTH domain-containing protein n=2 Tax=Melanopsichium pennsylvanicum TaxID=63383 RepID=A0AAJ4XLE9_9BASI|nr:conserved hypothetical protein [Melanopsichium pennsylvanicum 4]SNX84457.1 uncharacterized protein MEPE_03166 [Melanopsichium pennsylvanicum]